MKYYILFFMVAMMNSCKTENKSNEENDVDITNNKGQINVYYNNGEIKSKEARELNSDGVELAKKNELNQAETKFIKALNFEPNNPTILNNLGNVKKNQNEYEESIKYYEKSLNVSDSLYFNSALNIGIISYKTKDYSKSLKLLEYVIYKSNDLNLMTISHYYLARTYLATNECKKAKKHLEKSKKGIKNDYQLNKEFESYENKIKNCEQHSI